jgi:dihydrofolate reductase
MRKLIVFNSVTLDGYFTDKNNDMSWAHKSDPEFDSFTEENAKSGGELVFGRVTYEMMKSFWPTENARKMFPVVAEQMNDAKKIVFSRTLDEADWNNTRLIKGDLAEEVRKLKNEPGDTLVIMGSGTIVAQLTDAHLIDEYQMILNPIALGEGRTMFDGIKEKLDLKLTSTRAFKNGNVLMSYEAAVAREASAGP